MSNSTGTNDVQWRPFVNRKIEIDNKYRIKKLIGSGGEGGVFLADVVMENRLFGQVALKLRPTDFQDSVLLDKQMAELKAAITLNHPNLLRGLVPGKYSNGFQDYLYLVMEQAERTLDEEISPDKPLSQKETREVVQSIGSALVYLHNEQRIAHRDVKPANILRVGEVWKLGDFGLVREVGHDDDLRTGTFQCTPAYAPPESFTGRISLAWDVWSLGVIIVEMLTGKQPFSGDKETQVATKVLQVESLNLDKDLPKPFDEIVRGCLIKDHTARLTAEQVLNALNNKSGHSINPAVSLKPTPNPQLAKQIGKQILCFPNFTWIRSVSFSPDGTRAISGGGERIVDIWDLDNNKKMIRFPRQNSSVYAVSFSPDGKFCLSGNHDAILCLWDIQTETEIRHFQGHTAPIRSVTFSPDGKFALSGSDDMTVRLWEVNTGQEISCLKRHWRSVYSVAFSPDGSQALSGCGDKVIRLWDLKGEWEIKRFEGHEASISAVAFSPNGKSALSSSFDKTVRLWNVVNGEEIRCFQGHTDRVLSVAFSPNGNRILSGSSDKTLRLWDANTGQEICRCEKHTGDVWSVAFSPDGRRAVSGSHDKTVRVWDLPI
ncbi:serine/threonine protein kinase [Anabaenopsis sp. FSS-46]|uniref:serine/threonine-protein kinase n=1 Tax=Anabaenopsis sp. FSS-46 TaxID=2971766 RepID=UPI002476A277|nr:serine/threonine-protein kinase [Anabaenopsis sp. FSS-46]MDH6097556.1 serine/threonine protein kinase [Anabaenopsis sp. FSS-46]